MAGIISMVGIISVAVQRFCLASNLYFTSSIICVSEGNFQLFCVCKYKVTLRLSIFLQSKMPSHPLALEMEKY